MIFTHEWLTLFETLCSAGDFIVTRFFLSCFLILITQTETNGQGTSSMQKFINTVNSLKLIIGKGTPRLIYVNKSLDVGFAFVAR